MNKGCRAQERGLISGPHNIFRQALEMARVAGDEFVGLGFGRNQSVPIIVHSRTLDAQALGLVQTVQRFFFGQLLELKFVGEFSQPGRALVLSEYHSVDVPLLVGDLHAASSHGGQELRQKMQAGDVLPAVQAAENVRRYGGINRRRRVPIRPHERLSLSSATAFAMASGSSLYPVGT